MNIFHTFIIKIVSAVNAILFLIGPSTTPANNVTVVDVQDSGTTVTTVAPSTQASDYSVPVSVKPTVTPQTETSTTQPIPVYIIKMLDTPAVASMVAPVAPQPALAVQTQSNTVMQTTAKIEIKNPLAGKGLPRDIKSRAIPLDDLNKIYLGAVVYNPDGSINNTDTIEITTDDVEQNKTIVGTGDVSNFGDIGNPKYYYGFSYAIKTPGLHKITFTSKEQNVSADISFTVKDEDPR